MKILSLMVAVLLTTNVFSQQRATDLDKSPMDMSYYPSNYPVLKMKGQATVEPAARIIYSRPQKKGRDIFGGEVKYNEVWRLGANEATELELFKPAKIGGKKIAKGKYSLFCIPTANKWTLIVNKDTFSWGSFAYKNDKDVVRVDLPIQKNGEDVEAFTMYFDDAKDGAVLQMLWEDLKVSLPIGF